MYSTFQIKDLSFSIEKNRQRKPSGNTKIIFKKAIPIQGFTILTPWHMLVSASQQEYQRHEKNSA